MKENREERREKREEKREKRDERSRKGSTSTLICEAFLFLHKLNAGLHNVRCMKIEW